MTDRLDAFLDRLDRLNIDDLIVLGLPPPDPDERAVLLERARSRADAAGRGDEVRHAAATGRAVAIAAFSRRSYDPTWFGLNWGRSLGRAVDRATLIAAIEDAAVAAVLADDLDPEDVEALNAPFEQAASMSGTASDQNPSIIGSSARRAALVGAWLSSVLVIGAVPGIVGVAAILALSRRKRRAA